MLAAEIRTADHRPNGHVAVTNCRVVTLTAFDVIVFRTWVEIFAGSYPSFFKAADGPNDRP